MEYSVFNDSETRPTESVATMSGQYVGNDLGS